jgi:thioredoxin 1
MNTVAVTDASFEADVLKASKPVLVDFWAEWCGPCKQIAPALEQIAGELGSAITVAKINIEESPTTPSRYGVRGIPTMMLFKDGEMKAMKVGAMPKQKILDWLAETGVTAADAGEPAARAANA